MNISLTLPMLGAVVMALFAITYRNRKKSEGVLVASVGFVLFLIVLVYNFNHQ